jgi:hypothetical protein
MRFVPTLLLSASFRRHYDLCQFIHHVRYVQLITKWFSQLLVDITSSVVHEVSNVSSHFSTRLHRSSPFLQDFPLHVIWL